MGYIEDYMFFGSGHDCPRSYMEWGALSLVTHIAGKKIWLPYGGEQAYFLVRPNLYIANIGDAGTGKSVTRSQNKEIMRRMFPSYLQSSSIQSAQHMLKIMTNPSCERTWKDAEGFMGTKGKIYTYRPFYCLVDEMSNFVGVDKATMVNILVEMYSADAIDTGFKQDLKEGNQQWVEEPYPSVLGCAIPGWVMENFKVDLFVGGLGRRLIMVYDKRVQHTAFPVKPAGADAAMSRAAEHVKRVENFYGPMWMTAEANKWWIDWFDRHAAVRETDPILMQFASTKNIQLLKVALGYALSDTNFENREINEGHLQRALNALDALTPNIVRLTGGVGRNEIASVGAALMEHIRTLGGVVPETVLMKAYHRYLRDPEFQELMNHYCKTDQLFVIEMPGTQKRLWLLPEPYKEALQDANERKVPLGEAVKAWFERNVLKQPAPSATP